MTVPPPPAPLYGVVRADAGTVVIDTTDAAVTRLVGLLTRRPSLIATLSDASDPDSRSRHRAITSLRTDPEVREVTSCRLDVADATSLAVAIITAASSPGPVGTDPDRSANPRKDPR